MSDYISAEYQHKPTKVRAVRLVSRMTVENEDGIRVGRAGDWLIIDAIDGHRYFVTDSVFRQSYELVSDGDPL